MTSDPRTRQWWKRAFKRSLVVILILSLFGGAAWALNTIVSRDKKDVVIIQQTAPSLAAQASAPPKGDTFIINRDLIVKGATDFQKTLTVQGDARFGGNGVFAGTLEAQNFKGDGSQLSGILSRNCVNCVALQGTPTTAQIGNIHLDGDVTATNFRGRFFGDGSGLTNLPGLTGTFVALQDVSPGTQQTGHLNISGNGIFGSNLTAGGSLTVTGATALNNSLSISGTTTLTDLVASGQVRLTGNTADRLLIQPLTDPVGSTKLFSIKNAAGTEQASLTSDGILSLAGNATIGGNTTITGTLTATGATSLSTLSTSGAASR